MTPNKPGRGRPKGSGLNDAAQLRAIAGLIAADPDLKPTTAIRKIGITDPSIIRRLRDKFSAIENELIAEIAPRFSFGEATSAVVLASANTVLEVVTTDVPPPIARIVPLKGEKAECKTETVKTVTAPQPVAEPSALELRRAARPKHIQSPSETALPNWMGVGLSLYALSFEAQFAVLGSMFQWPPVAAVLKSQVAFTELAVAMTTSVVNSSRIG